MAAFTWLDAGPGAPGRLIVAVHHIVVDGVSLRVLAEDLAALWDAVAAGRPAALRAGRHVAAAVGDRPGRGRPRRARSPPTPPTGGPSPPSPTRRSAAGPWTRPATSSPPRNG